MKNVISFSIIIPVYNMENYLERCLNSVINQTYNPLEIILINDGSTDNSHDIIKSFKEKDKRILYIDKKNEGIGGAYVDALNVASGDYISFVDSDDYIELNMYETISLYLNRYDVDIIQFGLIYFNNRNEVIRILDFDEKYIPNNKILMNYHYKKGAHPGLGLKVYRKVLFDNIRIIKQNIGVDVLINLQVILKSKSMLIIKDRLYNVLLRQDSVCRTRFSEQLINQLTTLRSNLFDIISLKSNIHAFNYIFPILLNETIMIGNYYYKNNDFANMNKSILAFRKSYYPLFIKNFTLNDIMILFKAMFFKLFPVFYFKLFRSRIKQ